LHLAYEMPCPNESVVSIQGPTMVSTSQAGLSLKAMLDGQRKLPSLPGI